MKGDLRQMQKDDRLEIVESREYMVAKGNEIIQRARYDLKLQELKVFSFCVSRIKPTDEANQIYTFTINECCKVLGIETNNGKNINTIKQCLKKLRDTSFYLTLENGSETTVGWLDKVWIDKGNGKVRIRFDETLQDYLIKLWDRGNYTQYKLMCALPMTSAYSIRIYEILRSQFQGREKKRIAKIELSEMKRKLGCEHYQRFPDFRRKVLMKAVQEINMYTDIEVSWLPVTKGRKVIEIEFTMVLRDVWDRSQALNRANRAIEGQLTIYDYIDVKQ
jgi:plasmid replication initiation protein